MSVPTIESCLTPSPVTISAELPLKQARKRMFELGVRHLPVLRDGNLVGILSERDIALTESLTEVDDEFPVERAMQEGVFTVGAQAHLHAVAEEMAARKIGTAVVVDPDHPGQVRGIFTTVDALRALARLSRHD